MASHISQNQISFSVGTSQSYYLHVTIGDGQVGSTTFKNFSGQLFSPKVFNALIGTGAVMQHQTSLVVSVVMDVNPNTDNMSVSYYITTQPLQDPSDLNSLTPVATIPFPAAQSATTTFYTDISYV